VSWVWLYEKLDGAVKVRHYSPKALKAYVSWGRKLEAFTRSKDPAGVPQFQVTHKLLEQTYLPYLSISSIFPPSNSNAEGVSPLRFPCTKMCKGITARPYHLHYFPRPTLRFRRCRATSFAGTYRAAKTQL
jgi:hypothetical protein